MIKKRLTSIISIALSVLMLLPWVAGCSSATPADTPGSTATGAPVAGQSKVTIQNFAFSPQTITVAKGTSVTWMNNDSTSHTVTSDSNLFDSGPISPGATFSFTFNQTGMFPYHCKIHLSMTAQVIVQ